jgi:hypothetical protein
MRRASDPCCDGGLYIYRRIGGRRWSRSERYLDAGGIGALVGDGRLPRPGDEAIGEIFYDWKLLKPIDVTLDYQIVGSPGYNRDRGPACVRAALARPVLG